MYKSILFITLSLRTGSSTFSPGRPGGQHQQLQLVLYLGSDWLTATPISRLPLAELQGPVQRVGLTLNLRKNISTSSVHVLRSSRTRIFERDTGGNTNIASVVLFLGTDLAILQTGSVHAEANVQWECISQVTRFLRTDQRDDVMLRGLSSVQ